MKLKKKMRKVLYRQMIMLDQIKVLNLNLDFYIGKITHQQD